jgi:hypothetical protein
VYEHFIADVFVDGRACFDDVSEPSAGLLVLLLLGVNHEYHRSTVLYSLNISRSGVLEFSCAWEVLNRELNVRIVIDLYIKQLHTLIIKSFLVSVRNHGMNMDMIEPSHDKSNGKVIVQISSNLQKDSVLTVGVRKNVS